MLETGIYPDFIVVDGKEGAEDLIRKVLNDPALLQALASAPKPDSDSNKE